MKTLMLFIFVFSISFSFNYAQNGNNGTERKADDNIPKDEVKRDIQRTPPPIVDKDSRDTPHNPPTRNPNNGNVNNPPPRDRPLSPPLRPNNPPPQPDVIYAPIPIYDYSHVGEPDYTYPSEAPPAEEIEQNYEELGLSQYKQEDYYDALTSFQSALAKDTLNYSLYYYIGTTEIEIERYDDAVIDLTIFIDNVIENRMGFYQRGLANFYLGNKDEAFDDLVIADQYQVEDAKVILKRYFDY